MVGVLLVTHHVIVKQDRAVVRILCLVDAAVTLPRLRVALSRVAPLLHLRVPRFETSLSIYFLLRIVASVDLRLVSAHIFLLVDVFEVSPGRTALVLVTKL